MTLSCLRNGENQDYGIIFAISFALRLGNAFYSLWRQKAGRRCKSLSTQHSTSFRFRPAGLGIVVLPLVCRSKDSGSRAQKRKLADDEVLARKQGRETCTGP